MFYNNNQAHKSVGPAPTDYQQADFAKLAQAAGYVYAEKLEPIGQVYQIPCAVKKTEDK